MADVPIPCSPALGALLVQLRRDNWRDEQPPVLPGAVVDNAIARHVQLPDELLAYCAAMGTLAMLLSEDEELESFYRAEEQPLWRKKSGMGFHITFDAWGDWPRIYACYSPSEGTYGEFDLKTGTFSRTPTLEHLVADRLRVNRLRAEPLVGPAADAAFAPVIRRDDPAPARQVTHAKFGTGTVLEELEGKLRIDFGEHGIKLLAAKFVKDA